MFEFLHLIIGKIVFFCSGVGGETFPKPLSATDEAKYLKAFKEDGDMKAKDMLIKHNLRLVAHIAKKYQYSEDFDDLISVGSIGLIKAINTFKEGKGTQLATYTARCIENEILMLLRANKKHKNLMRLNDSIGKDKDGNELTLIDLIAESEDGVLSQIENRMIKDKFIEVIKNCLDNREYTIIILRYGLLNNRPLAQREVAKHLKISRSYISRIEKRCIEKIKDEIKKHKYFEE